MIPPLARADATFRPSRATSRGRNGRFLAYGAAIPHGGTNGRASRIGGLNRLAHTGIIQKSLGNGVGMNRLSFKFLASAAVALAPVPAIAADQAAVPAAATQSVGIPTMGAVSAFYDRFDSRKLWFNGSQANPAAAQLVQILQRAPVDGLASGPALAAQVQQAIAQAASGNPAAIQAAEQTLSAAWVLYVQTIKRPTPAMIYAYDVLKPQGTRPDQILLTASAASSLGEYLQSTASVNPIYASIRDAAWAEMQASGETAPDQRVLANLDRLRSIPARGRFVLVDIGTQRLFMYDNGVPVDSMKVIVGMDERPTPMIASVMYYVTFNPYWNAPDHLARSIARNYLSRGQKYLDSNGYEVMSNWTREATVIPNGEVDWKAVAAGKKHIRVRQKPGSKNFMGILKFPFPNPEDIYLHDTPTKRLFAEDPRTLSNGCIRLEDAERFGRWLLGREPTAPGSEPEIQIQVPRPVPVYVTYITAQPSDKGLTFTKDVYGWDKPGAAQLALNNMIASRVPRD